MWRKADRGGLVQVVDDLADQPRAGDGDTVKGPIKDEWIDDAVHVVLGRLQRQKVRRAIGPETSGFSYQRPEELQCPTGEPADGGDGDHAARRRFAGAQRFVIRGRQGPLRNQDQDLLAGDAFSEQVIQTAHTQCSFARTGRTGQEDGVVGLVRKGGWIASHGFPRQAATGATNGGQSRGNLHTSRDRTFASG